MPSRSVQQSLAGKALAGETNVATSPTRAAFSRLDLNTPDRPTKRSPPNAPLRDGGRGKVLRHIVLENRLLRQHIKQKRNGIWVPRGPPFCSIHATKAKKADTKLWDKLRQQLCDRRNRMDNCRRELFRDETDGKWFRSDSS